jgi:hypothetical protein
MVIDDDKVRPHRTRAPDRFEIQRPAIQGDEDLCVRVGGHRALGNPISLLTGRDYDLESGVVDLLEKQGHLRGRGDSIAIVIGDHHYFIAIGQVLCEQTGPLGHPPDAQVVGKIL